MPDPQTHDRDDLTEPSASNRYEVTARDLPVSCPMPGMYLWSAHPRVYLPVAAQGSAVCPYCGATYILKDDDKLAVEIGGSREWK